MITDRNPSGPNLLTQEDAAARATRVHDVAYDLTLSLQTGVGEYDGAVTIRFHDRSPDQDLFLDCTGKEISQLRINGQETQDPRWESNRLHLLAHTLQESNTIEITYRNTYDHHGMGLHHFVDPEDGQEYCYTQFEPYDAHRLFPCFDQPDIKAQYQLRITASTAWAIVTNSPEEQSEPGTDDRTTRTFAQTALLSPYLFALVAGPFHKFEDRHGAIPLAVYCRQSLAKHVDPEELFTVTKQGLTFFAEFFDYPYPFGKYDQCFVPEFNFGAMENAGCITFSERMVFRDPPTDLQRLNRAEVVLHEMAHMWFGDLVTMRWWNDLWLNESFATYMAYLALYEATRFHDGAWAAFFSRMKAWAYDQDELVTTHAIAGDVPNTEVTFLNFDGITYGKGAAALKQLVAAIGPEGFRDGMRHYFQTYAWGNTTLREFLGALEHGAGRALQRWSRVWLEEAGCNTLRPVWSVDASGMIIEMHVEQEAPADHPTLRPHRLDMAVFSAGTEAPQLREVMPLEIDGISTSVPDLSATRAPGAIFLNHGDHAFAKIILDPISLAFVQERLERFDDPLMRLLLWHTLWTMVRDRAFRSTDYLALAIDKLARETNLELISAVLGNAQFGLAHYIPPEQRRAQAARLYDFCHAQLYAATDPDQRIVWARALIDAVQDPDRIAAVLRLADEGTGIDGFALDQDMRWSLAIKASGYGLPDAAARVTAELEQDRNDRGTRAAETARVAPPDPYVKAAAWQRYRENREASLHMMRAAMQGFFWIHQAELTRPYVDRFFNEVREIFATRDRDFARSYFNALYPSHLPEDAVIAQGQALLDTLPAADRVLSRLLREALDESHRAQACRDFAMS